MRLAPQDVSTLSLTFLISFLVAAWSANAAVKAIFDALNIIYREREKRSFIKLNAISLMTTISGVVLLVDRADRDRQRAGDHGAVSLRLSSWSGSSGSCAGPPSSSSATTVDRLPLLDRPEPPPGRASSGCCRARSPRRCSGAAASWAFSWYVGTLGNYTATYGSLATVVVFMTWLWLSATIVLAGAELNAELEHQTAADTTIGRPKPMGLRGATMADTLGPPVAEE